MSGSSADRGDLIMFRKDLITLLLGNPMGVSQIAREVKEPPGQVADDLEPVINS